MHTPGPWHIHDEYRDEVRGPQDEMVCATYAIGNEEANGRLIAAAPELLEALKVLAEKFPLLLRAVGNSADVVESNIYVKNAQAAIAKAEAHQ